MENESPEKISVLIVAASLRRIGGQSIQARSLLDAFAGHEQISMDFLPNDPQLRHFGFLQSVKGLRTVFTSLKFWWLLFREIRRFDLIQVFSSATTGYLISTLPPLLFAKLYRKKIILNYHSGEAEAHIRNWRWIARPTMKMFDRIAVPSQFLVDVFAKFDLRATAIYNFPDTGKFSFRPRKPLRPVFLSNRNFEKHYNVGCILRAFEMIQKKVPEAELLIAGSGSEEKSLKNLAEELELINIRFLGKVSPEEMPAVYAEADIYLNSSIVDNMPLSIIEAFAAGLPVVSTAVGGIPYIVADGKTGLLVPVNDCRQLAEKALQLLQDESLAERLVENALTECEKYRAEVILDEWVGFYRETVRLLATRI